MTSNGILRAFHHRVLRVRHGDRGDDGAALILVLLAMMIATSLSLLLLGTLLAQNTSAVFDRKNIRAIHAAEAGVDVALTRIRAAKTADPLQSYAEFGDRTKLPCRLQGFVQGSPGNMQYDVEIRYYTSDPAVQTAAWRDANQITCAQGAGTLALPRYALILADGMGDGVPRLSVQAGDRRLETIYDIQLTNQNIAGGVIKNFQDGNPATLELCWDAGPAPAFNTRIKIQDCDASLPQQTWAWRSDFTIALAQTVGPGQTELCATAEIGAGTKYLVLRPCTAIAEQKFGFSNTANFTARTPTGDLCVQQAVNNGRGTDLLVTNFACGQGQDPHYAWQPSPLVGAGSVGNVGNSVAGKQLQWVNYAEFGRCFDVSNWIVSYVSMISYPCKQMPGESVGWNQTLEWDATTKQLFTRAGSSGQPYTTTWANGSPKYCVTAQNGNNQYVKMTACDTSRADQRWEVNRELPGNYTSSYTVVDIHGRCMSVGPPNSTAPDPRIRQWSSIVSANCNGSGQQKWNAPPDPTKPVVRDTVEVNN